MVLKHNQRDYDLWKISIIFSNEKEVLVIKIGQKGEIT